MSQDGTYEIPGKTSINNETWQGEVAGSDAIAQNYARTCAQDWHKFDTASSGTVPGLNEKENPDASGKANGADQLGISFKTEEYRLRAERATTLCMAIADCDPRESLQILAAALEDMSRGSPLPVLLSPMEDARWWASFAQPNELKSYAVACFEAMAPKVQVSFLAHVQRGASA